MGNRYNVEDERNNTLKKLTEYIEENKKMADFGISYLDDRLKGILRGDLILIGARSGAGKSSIADIIATYNAKRGVKVTLISLENFEGDNFISKAYYKYKELTQNWKLTLREFASYQFEPDIFALEECEKYARKEYENIQLINRQKDYTIENLKNDIINAVENENSSLVIIDHVDYLDKFDNETEITHITNLMKSIRNAQYAFKVPVIAISHLRKAGNSKLNAIVPNMDEFIGSSNKVKESTVVIMLAPDDESNMQSQNNLKATWCCVRKLRMGGIDNQAAKIFYNQKTGGYEGNYTLYKVSFLGDKVEPA